MSQEDPYLEAQKANESFFMENSANPKVIEEFQSFQKQVEDKKRPEVNIDGLSSRSRILLIRLIIQEIVEKTEATPQEQRKNIKVDYVFGVQRTRNIEKPKKYTCFHNPTSRNGRMKAQKGDLLLTRIYHYHRSSRYKPSIEKRLNQILADVAEKAEKAGRDDIIPAQYIAQRMRESRISGTPIAPDELIKKESAGRSILGQNCE